MDGARKAAPGAARAKIWAAAGLFAVLVVAAGGARARASGPAESPLAGAILPSPVRFDGRVTERLEAGSYAYLRVEREGSAPAWVVALRPRSRPGDRVHVDALGRARDFDSRRLGRRFDELWFASVRTFQ